MSTHRTGLGLNLLSLQQLQGGPELPESHFHLQAPLQVLQLPAHLLDEAAVFVLVGDVSGHQVRSVLIAAPDEGGLAHVHQAVAMRLAEEATGTWASVQSSIRLQLPGDEIQKPAGGVVAELTLHGQGCAHRRQQTSLEGTAQPRLAVPLAVTDGPVAAFGGRFGAVTPDAQRVSTTLAVPGAECLLVPARLAGVPGPQSSSVMHSWLLLPSSSPIDVMTVSEKTICPVWLSVTL